MRYDIISIKNHLLNKEKIFVKIILILIFSSIIGINSVLAFSPPTDDFFILNRSNVPIYITSRFRYCHSPEYSGAIDHTCGFNIDYYVSDIFLTRIIMGTISEVENHIYYPVDNIWHSFRIITFRANSDLASDNNYYFNLFTYLLEEFIIYDNYGNIILTLSDIKVEDFTFEYIYDNYTRLVRQPLITTHN